MKNTLRFLALMLSIASAQLCAQTVLYPQPQKVDWPSTPAHFSLPSSPTTTARLELTGSAELLAPLRFQLNTLHFPEAIANALFTSTDSLVGRLEIWRDEVIDNEEAYVLEIDANGIRINAGGEAGALYALTTLLQLTDSTEAFAVRWPHVRIEDAPAFTHRGFMLDAARHFFDANTVIRYLDLLALHKMNVFHWHLTDDQGWRLQLPQFPELTNIGSVRSDSSGTYEGFYTVEEVQAVVAHAAQLHITVIPEIEMPGHAVAALAAYPQYSCTGDSLKVATDWGVFKDVYCVSNPATIDFLHNVLDAVWDLFPGPYVHIGGDEVPTYRWEHCPRCSRSISEHGNDVHAFTHTFFTDIATHLRSRNRTLIGWDEIADAGMPAGAIVQCWRGMEPATKAAQEKRFAIVSPTSHCYLDYPLASIDAWKVARFDPTPDVLSAEEAAFIRGGEVNLWSEHVASIEKLDAQVFPRLSAFCEVMWSDETWREAQTDEQVQQRLLSHMERLKNWNVKQSFPSTAVQWRIVEGDAQHLLVEALPTWKDETTQVRIHLPEPWTAANENTRKVTVTSLTTVSATATSPLVQLPQTSTLTVTPHEAFGKTLVHATAPSDYYTGGGMNALMDGICGSFDFRDGHWQAAQGTDLEAVIDLQKETEISSVTTHFYHYQQAWIFRPKRVMVFASNDGKRWKKLATHDFKKTSLSEAQHIENCTLVFKKRAYRYVQIIAFNEGPCPAWHAAAGEPSWLFWDEVIVK